MRTALHPEIAPAIREVLRRSDKPVSLAQLHKQLTGPFRVPEKRKSELLAVLANSANGFYQWPKFRGSVRFWDRDARAVAEAAAIELALKAMAMSKLVKALPKRAFGYPAKLAEKLIKELLRDSKLFKETPWEPKSKLTSVKPDPEQHRKKLDGELTAILKKYAALGISPKSLVVQICESGEIATNTQKREPEEETEESIEVVATKIMAALENVEPQKGLVVSVSKIRQSPALKSVTKAHFDDAVIHLLEERRIFLHDHSAPYTLNANDRDQLVSDGRGGFYVGIAWREPERLSGIGS